MFAKVQNFIGEVMAEMQKVTWTKGNELLDSTLVVIFSALLLGTFVACIDFFYSKGVTIFLK